MIKAKSSSFLAGLLLAGTFLSQPASAETLTDALINAYQTHPSLGVSRANLRATDETVALARAPRRIQLNATLSASKTRDHLSRVLETDSQSAALTATLLLYDGGQSRQAVESARMQVLAGRQALIGVEQDLLLDAVTAYMNYLRDREFVQLAKNNVRVLRQQVRASRDRFEVGEVTRTDVSQAESRLANARANLENNQGSLEVSRQTYKAIIGFFPKSPQQPPPAPKLPKTATEAESIAVQRHPRILQARFNLDSSNHDLERQKRNWKPSVTGSVSASRTDSTVTGAGGPVTYGIAGTVPIYQGGQLKALRRQALAIVERRNFELQEAGLITRQLVNQAYSNWQVASANIAARSEEVRAARVAFEGVSEEAKLGARTTLDTLDAEQELLNARTNLVSARRDRYVAVYSVLSEMGLLTVEHLNLGIESYNPDVYYSSVNGVTKLGEKRDKLLDKLLKRRGN